MIEKLFNNVSVFGGVFGGLLVSFLGGYDYILKALVALAILDYITGIMKAIKKRTLSSEIGFIGLLRKIVIFIMVGTAVILQGATGDIVPLREITIVFYICNEGISLLENASEFVPLPEKLKETLIQIRDSGGKSNE